MHPDTLYTMKRAEHLSLVENAVQAAQHRSAQRRRRRWYALWHPPDRRRATRLAAGLG